MFDRALFIAILCAKMSRVNKYVLSNVYKFALYRHVFECASSCNNLYYCSAFRFEEETGICYFGAKNSLNNSSTQVPDKTISIHVNPNDKDQGKHFFTYI